MNLGRTDLVSALLSAASISLAICMISQKYILLSVATDPAKGGSNKYPPAKPEVLRLLAPQRGLTAIAKSKPKTEKTTNDRLPELSNFVSPPAEPGVYHD